MEPDSADPKAGSWWERNRQTVEIVGIWIEALGVLIAAVFGIHQYRENSRAEKVNVTLKYLDRFQADRLFNAREALETAWAKRGDEVFTLMQQADGEDRLRDYMEQAIREERLEPSIHAVMDFYDELQACASSGLCDQKTALRFFGKYADDFHGLLAPHVALQRERLRDRAIGSGIDYFSHEYRRARARSNALREAGGDR